MILGPITHAGANWRKLCQRCGLDPQQATAADIEAALCPQSTAIILRELIRAAGAAESYLTEDPIHPERQARREAVLEQLAAALGPAIKHGG